MDSASVHFSLDLVSGCGSLLSPEQKTALQTSLVILKRNYKFTRVLFWGKIFGIKADYYIARGLGADEMRDKTILYSLNCMDWNLLPPATKDMIAEASVIKGWFMGDPSHEYEYSETKKTGEEDQEEETSIKIKEEHRLTATISLIDDDVAVVPRGAYIQTPHGHIHTNRSFQGLSMTEAKKLNNYFHFTEPIYLKKKSLLEKADMDPSIDFLDSLEEDVPKGSWSLQSEKGNSVVLLRSLLWLGLSFYHIPMTSHHGYIYMGTGQKNIDLPFML
ncbi:radial spoke head protein 9 homolog [Erpetoichthys calabaricus]|uniref:Radial spoke head protein 9 homolog n=1 Tax=Erpetoichthys calabaricus TaxID=27687 RepID=A0A8C4RIQ4_ERPCA|nr:radial spoke head protein 9 homolog [Erpetoichthys calabaricus]